MSQDLERVAQRLKRWRDEAGLSLQALASRSGVAASTIQKIERQQMVPTIAVLLKISHGLGRQPTAFLEEKGEPLEVVHLAAVARNVHPTAGGTTLERLCGDVIEPGFEAWRIEHPTGGSIGRLPLQYEGEMIIVCETGELTVEIGDETHRVGAGDSLHWKAKLPHSWLNHGAEPARFVIAGTLPRDLRRVLRPNADDAIESIDDPEQASRTGV